MDVSEVESLRRRVTQLENELFEEQREVDRLRDFAMRRVDTLTGLGAWTPGESEEQRTHRENKFMW